LLAFKTDATKRLGDTVPTQSIVKQGLCSTCVNAATCMYLKSRRHPVHQCEQFDDYVAPISMRKANPTISDAGNNPTLARQPNGRQGLCSTCDSWETCVFCHSEGGVWHCDEYH
jgi:hypothetical protein